MYYRNRNDIIEGTDIADLHDLRLEKREDGLVLAHFTVSLQNYKDFFATDQEHQLHITDGANHRVLGVTPLPSLPVLEEHAPEDVVQVAELHEAIHDQIPADNADNKADQ